MSAIDLREWPCSSMREANLCLKAWAPYVGAEIPAARMRRAMISERVVEYCIGRYGARKVRNTSE
ncbi:MAG: hypothetical protein LWX54_02035 [Deltaproteobacteria bacterium]|nr:hypothetical protein [Deltaproteobacteria bacterium]